MSKIEVQPMKSIQQLREQRTQAAAKARQMIDSIQSEDWSADNTTAYDAIMADIDDIDSQINRHQKLLDTEAANRTRVENRADNAAISIDNAQANQEMETGIFNSFLRGGKGSLNNEQRDYLDNKKKIQGAMSTTTDAEGGYLVPDGFSGLLLEELKQFGGVRNVARILRTATGNTIEWPTVNATAQVGELLAENTTSNTLDVTFGVKSLDAYRYSSKDIAIPFELLQDNQIDLEGYIIKLLGERIARITNQHFTTGTGTGQPNGVVTASSEGKEGTATQTTTVIYDDLVDLIHSIDPAYRQTRGCNFMFHDSTLKALKKLKDSDGRPLWVPGLAVAEPDTILGYGYTINQDMAVMAASAKAILFGDFSSYIIRDVMDLTLFRMTDSAYTKLGQVGFLSMSRHDGDLMDSSGSVIKHFANPAS